MKLKSVQVTGATHLLHKGQIFEKLRIKMIDTILIYAIESASCVA